MSEESSALAKQAALQREVVRSRDQELAAKALDLQSRMEALRARMVEAEAQAASIEASRDPKARAVDVELLRRYDAIRRRRMPALVEVTAGGTCTGCRMNLRPQMYNQLVASRGIDTCPSCSRMVYAAEVLEEASPKAEAE
jgi:hypothetical protein